MGRNVSLNPDDIKYSYSLENCSAAYYLSQKYSVAPSQVVVIGRKGGPVLKTGFATSGGLPVLNIDPVALEIDLGTYYGNLCRNWTGAAATAPLRGVWPSFNFSQEYLIAFKAEIEDEYVDVRLRFVAWGISDGQFVVPAVRVTDRDLEITRVNSSLLVVALTMTITQEYFVDADYDPTIELLFASGQTLAPGASPEAAALLAQESNIAAIVGGAVGAICFVAIIAVVVAMMKSPSFRAKVLPFSGRRSASEHAKVMEQQEDSSLVDGSSGKQVNQKPNTRGGWKDASPKQPVSNIK